MWKVGLIGTGYWSEKHLDAWKRIPSANVEALCNRSRDKLEQRGRQYGISESYWYQSVDEMLQSAEIDVVDIVTGPETHMEIVTKAAKHGKHIMCQKPFAINFKEAQEMVRITEECGVRLMVTENWRWLKPNQIIKRLLDEGKAGKIHVARYVHTDFYTPRMIPEKPLPQPFFREMPKLLFYEMGAHWFDTWRFLFGHPKRIYAEMKRISPHIVGEDTGAVIFGYDDLYGIMDMSWATRRELEGHVTDPVKAEHREQIVIEGDIATLKLYMSGKISLVDNYGIETIVAESTGLDHAESHYRLQSHFIECLDSGEEFQTSGKDNLKTFELIFAAYESAINHRVIYL